MNFTKILSQLNEVEMQNRQIDRKFMTDSTFEKKYKTKKMQEILSSPHINSSASALSPTFNTLLKQPKHRYF